MPGSNTQFRFPRKGGVLLLALLLVLGAAVIAHAQEGDISRGAALYDANCKVCHGAEGQGRVGADLSQAFPSINPSAFLRQIIAAGVEGTPMTPWSQANGGPLTEAEVDDLVTFVDSLSGGRSPNAPTSTPIPVTPVPTVPGVSGDPTQGRVLFIENCAMCHGQQGQGRVGANLSRAFASINPQQYVRATVARGIDGTAMPPWSQTNGGPLTETEIDNISAYIISLARPETPTEPVAEPEPEQGGASSILMVLLALVVVAVLTVVIVQMSSRARA